MTVLKDQEQGPERREVPTLDYRGWLIVGVLLVLVLNGVLFTWAFIASRQVPTVRLYNLQMVGNVEICPGDPLNYEFNLYVSTAGDVDLIGAMQRTALEERGTVTLYTTVTKFRTEEETDIVIVRDMPLPLVYTNVVTDRIEKWRPGGYRLRLTARAVGRSSEGSVLYIPFRIRQDCELE